MLRADRLLYEMQKTYKTDRFRDIVVQATFCEEREKRYICGIVDRNDVDYRIDMISEDFSYGKTISESVENFYEIWKNKLK